MPKIALKYQQHVVLKKTFWNLKISKKINIAFFDFQTNSKNTRKKKNERSYIVSIEK